MNQSLNIHNVVNVTVSETRKLERTDTYTTRIKVKDENGNEMEITMFHDKLIRMDFE